MVITRYKFKGPALKAAVVADVHGKPSAEMVEALRWERPDVIFVPGDLCDCGYVPRHADTESEQAAALRFLSEMNGIAPVFYAKGNHEFRLNEAFRTAVRQSGAVLLENSWAEFNGIYIGGLDPQHYYGANKRSQAALKKDTLWLKERPAGYKILLCHQPEYYPLVRETADLIVSGHTHGGQWRIGGRGLFAPGQGILPKYSYGVYGNMIVSSGLSREISILGSKLFQFPGLGNPKEIVIIHLEPEPS